MRRLWRHLRGYRGSTSASEVGPPQVNGAVQIDGAPWTARNEDGRITYVTDGVRVVAKPSIAETFRAFNN